MSDAALDLRPMGIADILDRGFSLYRRNFKTFFGIALGVHIVIFLVSLPYIFMMPWVQATAGRNPMASAFAGLAVGLGSMFLGVIIYVMSFVGTAALTLAVSERFMGRGTGVADAWRRTVPRLMTLIAIPLLIVAMLVCAVFAALIVFAAAAGIVALIAMAAGAGNTPSTAVFGFAMMAMGVIVVMGVMLAAMLYFYMAFLPAPPVAMVEGLGPIAALKRSRELMRLKTEKGFFNLRSNSSKAAIILVVLFAVQLAVTIVVQIPVIILRLLVSHGSLFDPGAIQLVPWYVNAIGGALTAIGNSLVAPIYAVPIVLLYYDIRIRFEGFDLEMMARALGRPSPDEGTTIANQ